MINEDAPYCPVVDLSSLWPVDLFYPRIVTNITQHRTVNLEKHFETFFFYKLYCRVPRPTV